MEKQKTDTEGKIVLPAKLQQEMMRFFLRTSIPKIAEAKRREEQTPSEED